MTYTPQTWHDLPATDTPVSAARLAYMEAGIAAAAAGSPVVRKFPFAFDSAGILTGHTVYTPTAGDILLDAWIEVTTVWDGTSPHADFYDTVRSGGYFSSAWYGTGLPPTIELVNTRTFMPLSTYQAVAEAFYNLQTAAIANTPASAASFGIPASSPLSDAPGLPTTFPGANPIKIVVSQDGSKTGADPVSTQGAGVLYLITATPI